MRRLERPTARADFGLEGSELQARAHAARPLKPAHSRSGPLQRGKVDGVSASAFRRGPPSLPAPLRGSRGSRRGGVWCGVPSGGGGRREVAIDVQIVDMSRRIGSRRELREQSFAAVVCRIRR